MRLQVSLACRDLLEQLLTPEPEERISLSRIMRHPWFLKAAPPGLTTVNDLLLSQDRRKCAPLRSWLCGSLACSAEGRDINDPASQRGSAE